MGPRLVLQLLAWHPGMAVEPVTKLGPLTLPGMLTWGYVGSRLSLGDAEFDRVFAVEAAYPEFTRALLDARGRVLVQGMRSSGTAAWVMNGRTLIFMLGGIATQEQALEVFASVERWLNHLHSLPPIAPPPGLCHLCGAVIIGSGERCGHCTAHFHKHCLETYGACPLVSCTSPDRILHGLIAYATTGVGRGGAAEIRAAGPEHFRLRGG